mmetsp:Transcript_130978/g.407337  ORF Transcript_130978/g.407337 Transcript_130978/m.407337 type:complete len:170 (+) Transcript_130978:1905-2414(+)
MKGNQGTVYLAVSTTHYVCRHAVALEKDITSGEGALRRLKEEELFEVLEGPRTETKRGALLARGRALRGGDEGWFPAEGAMRLWSAPHRCVRAVDLRDSEEASAAVLRRLEAGELLEALEPPQLEEGTGALRLRLRAERDGLVGFAPALGPDGGRALEPVAAALAAVED